MLSDIQENRRSGMLSTCVRCPDCVTCSGGNDLQRVMIGEAWALPPDSNVQRYEPLTSATGTNFHACYLKRSYKSCAVPIQDQYVAWRSDDPARSATSGPARCPGSTSCIETGVDFGGGVEGCGYAPLVGIASNAGAFIPPVWWSEDTLLEPSLHSAEDCQTICRDYKDAAGNATCEYFSYEWETFKYNVEQIDVFRCPGGDAACVDTISTANHLVRTRGCAIGSDEPFCAVCQPSFSMKNGICQKCDESATGRFADYVLYFRYRGCYCAYGSSDEMQRVLCLVDRRDAAVVA